MRMLACKRAREWGKNPSGNVDAVDIRVSARADSALSAAQNMFIMHIWYVWYACGMHEGCMRCVCRAFRSMRAQWPPPMRGDTDPRLCMDLARVKNMLLLTHISISMQSFTAYKKSLRPLSYDAGQWLTGPRKSLSRGLSENTRADFVLFVWWNICLARSTVRF